MTILGRVVNGVVVLEGSATLPEGAAVAVSYVGASVHEAAARVERVQLPLVRTGEPGTVHLTGARIAELLEEEDVAPRR